MAVRSLFLEMVYKDSINDASWRKAIVACTKQLKMLQNVSISIDWRKWSSILGPQYRAELEKKGLPGKGSVKGMPRIGNVISDVLTLRKLPLKTATMVISDRGTEEKRQAYVTIPWTE